jgi:hypothetical protein
MKIAVRIDRLVLDGLPVTPADGQQIRRAVRAELGRLLTIGGPQRLSAAAGAVPALAAPTLQLAGGESPKVLGTRIAHAVHDALQGAHDSNRR